MQGHHVIYVQCGCGREGQVPQRPEWDALTRRELLPRMKCAACGKRQAVDMRLVWQIDVEPLGRS